MLTAELRADWLATLNYSGFYGRYALGTIYEFNEFHAVETSIGFYKSDSITYSQINVGYRYSPYQIPIEEHIWTPFQTGVFLNYSLDGNRYFINSPDKYPYKNYYDQTALRGGVEFGTTFSFNHRSDLHNFEVAYRFRIIDTGLVAIYNNAHRDLQYYLSSGIALNYRFQ